MNVNWGVCEDDKRWCDFDRLNLNTDIFNDMKGVYIIWSGKTVIRLGSGIIKDRITAHREDAEINKYENMKVTWAEVNANQMQGVEKYLSDAIEPLVGDRFPDRAPIKINLPWN